MSVTATKLGGCWRSYTSGSTLNRVKALMPHDREDDQNAVA